MLDSQARNFYQKICVEPMLRFLGKRRVSSAQLTLAACLFGIAVCPLLAFKMNALAAIALLVSGYLDTLDGSLARHKKAASPLGAVFDITSDRLVEFSVIFGLFLLDPSARALPALLMLGSVLLCITTFLVVGIFSQNSSEKSFHYSPGLIERTEAFILWLLMIFLPGYFSQLAYTFTALVFLTAVLHLRQFYKLSK